MSYAIAALMMVAAAVAGQGVAAIRAAAGQGRQIPTPILLLQWIEPVQCSQSIIRASAPS